MRACPQLTHGVREIRKKTEAYMALTDQALRLAIAEKSGPIVYLRACIETREVVDGRRARDFKEWQIR
jgi:hypothetical protein